MSDPSLSEALVGCNLESWGRIVAFYESLSSHRDWRSKRPLLRLARCIQSSDIARYFRARQSLWTLMISVEELSKRSIREPIDMGSFIRLESHRGRFHLTLRKSADECAEICKCRENRIMSNLVPLLERLWRERRGGECPALGQPIPEYCCSWLERLASRLFGHRATG